MAFKIPQKAPQDLLLISDIVGVSAHINTYSPPVKDILKDDSDIASSDEEEDAEVEAVLTLVEEDVTESKSLPEPSDSSSESDSSSASDSDDEDSVPLGDNFQSQGLDDDEDPIPPASGTYFQTKHEVVDAEIPIPKIEEVGPEEVLEKVGEVLNTMEKVAIVKGLPSEVANRGSDRALDSDTLLVFNDRKVLGYIYETFGPTSQPLYQVKFNNAYPLDPEKVRAGREVFHVPARSRFVFLSQIKAFKGSDASNVHDEEPAEDELEFSDDEAEAAYRSRLKRKRGESRARSVTSSRQETPSPSQMRDQDLVDETFINGNAYDARGPYDVDFNAAGPSRPQPIPYDDPYSDDYHLPNVKNASNNSVTHSQRTDHTEQIITRDRGHRQPERSGRARGRDRGRSQGDRVRGGYGRGDSEQRPLYGNAGHGPRQETTSQISAEAYTPSIPRPLSPTSLAIAHATGQLPRSSDIPPQHFLQGNSASWEYNQGQMQHPQPYAFGQQRFQEPFAPMPFVQPHINPRFAAAFSMGFNSMHGEQYSLTNQYSHMGEGGMSWTDEWTVPVRPNPSEEESKNSGK